MKRAALIDHSFRAHSRSNSFLLDLLRREYQVDVYRDDSWNSGPSIDLAEIGKKDYDLSIFFQMLPSSGDELDQAGLRNVVIIPMYDHSHWEPDRIWKDLRKHRFINFSRNLHDRMLSLGLNSLYLQYYCPPLQDVWGKDKKNRGPTGLTGLFWQRYELVNWNHISSLIKHSDFKKIHIHKAIDPPGYEFYPPSQYEMDRYSITFSEWFDTRDKYLELLEKADVFFASRKFEGIGLSFIEALSMGKCVVAPNHPTMNEYIEDGRNGLLYDLWRLKPLDLSRIEQISENARASAEKGYEQWLASREKILDFCLRPPLLTDSYRPDVEDHSSFKEQQGTGKNLRHLFWRKLPRVALFLHRIKYSFATRRPIGSNRQKETGN